jgi:hypothetical protein
MRLARPRPVGQQEVGTRTPSGPSFRYVTELVVAAADRQHLVAGGRRHPVGRRAVQSIVGEVRPDTG